MADKDGIIEVKNFSIDIPQSTSGHFVKGAENTDWGMKSRMSKLFNPRSGKTLMLAFDHGYIMGPTAGLERLDLAIPPLAIYADALMGTRGAFRSVVSPHLDKGTVLRCSAGSSVLDEDMSHEVIGVDIEDAIRMNATCMAIQVFIGASGQTTSIDNLVKTINAGAKYGIPTMGVVAVGKEMARTTKYFLLATRLIAELGASVVKTYYCEDFSKVAAACPVPIVIAGGKKLPERDALEMAYRAMQDGAAGVDMGRNVFQSESPVAMIQAVRAVIHEGINANQAFEMYNDIRRSHV